MGEGELGESQFAVGALVDAVGKAKGPTHDEDQAPVGALKLVLQPVGQGFGGHFQSALVQ